MNTLVFKLETFKKTNFQKTSETNQKKLTSNNYKNNVFLQKILLSSERNNISFIYKRCKFLRLIFFLLFGKLF